MGKLRNCRYYRCPKPATNNLHPCQHCGSLCKKRTNSKAIVCSIKCRLLGASEEIGDCLLWRGDIKRSGYGIFMAFGKRDQRVHRVAYIVFKGEIPNKHIVHHICHVKVCINPNHLLIGTAQDLSDDFGSRHGHPKGERAPHSKLKESQIKEIRELYEKGSSQQSIADKFSVSQYLISCIVRRKYWSHI